MKNVNRTQYAMHTMVHRFRLNADAVLLKFDVLYVYIQIQKCEADGTDTVKIQSLIVSKKIIKSAIFSSKKYDGQQSE